MGAAFFYHLTQEPLDTVLPELLTKALGQGWRVEVRGREEATLARLDDILWLRPEDGFMAHGRAGGEADAHQPVLLTLQGQAPDNGAVCLMAVDGAEVSADEVEALARVCILFDGGNEAAVEHARDQWRTLTGAGVAAQYWAQDGGRWTKKAETS